MLSWALLPWLALIACGVVVYNEGAAYFSLSELTAKSSTGSSSNTYLLTGNNYQMPQILVMVGKNIGKPTLFGW